MKIIFKIIRKILRLLLLPFQAVIQWRKSELEKVINQKTILFEAVLRAITKYQKHTYPDHYFRFDEMTEWRNEFNNLFESLINNNRLLANIKTIQNSASDIKKYTSLFIHYFSNIDELRNEHNKLYIKSEMQKYEGLFKNVEGRSLDIQQQECIIKDESNHLVIAGAGSGKTTTIVGKVKYLLERFDVNPDEIVVLSYTRNSAQEMAQRLLKETNQTIQVKTFHSFGLGIVREVEKNKELITMRIPEKFSYELIDKLKREPEYCDLITTYFMSYLKKYKSPLEFNTHKEYSDYLRVNYVRSFLDECVRSFEEMEIANFLFINDITYDYERNYEFEIFDPFYEKKYKPDFYLPDYGIYIEHFGINRDREVPKFFRARNGVSAKEYYNHCIDLKIQTHAKYNTKLVITYSYEKTEGTLFEGLKSKLQAHGVLFKDLTPEEILEKILSVPSTKYEYNNLAKLLNSFLSLMRLYNYDINEVRKINSNKFNGFTARRNEAFLNIMEPIYLNYMKLLRNKIDFSDMINRATTYVESGKYPRKIKYLIVDEYQDIDLPNFNFLKALKDNNKCNIFCVGDDWQSIYKFKGSYIDLFTKFDTFLSEYVERSRIETTYRFCKSIIDTTGNFIMKNKSQIRKQLKSFRANISGPIEIVLSEKNSELTAFIKSTLVNLPENSKIIFLGRYNDDLNDYLDDELVEKKSSHISYNLRPDLKIRFYSVHSSKGLEADFVFILNNTNAKMGFPSNIESDDVLKLILSYHDEYEYAEERRLFYVALTRTKNKVWLLVDTSTGKGRSGESVFIRELKDENNNSVVMHELSTESTNINKTAGYKTTKSCAVCDGTLLLKTGKYGEFLGCSNFPLCKYTRQAAKRSKKPVLVEDRNNEYSVKIRKVTPEIAKHLLNGNYPDPDDYN